MKLVMGKCCGRAERLSRQPLSSGWATQNAGDLEAGEKQRPSTNSSLQTAVVKSSASTPSQPSSLQGTIVTKHVSQDF